MAPFGPANDARDSSDSAEDPSSMWRGVTNVACMRIARGGSSRDSHDSGFDADHADDRFQPPAGDAEKGRLGARREQFGSGTALRIVEVSSAHVNKGAAVLRMLSASPCDVAVLAGDDTADESMFQLATSHPRRIAIRIGEGETCARYRLPTPAALRDFLQWGPVLGRGARAVRGLPFDKTPGANWKVAWHQDLSIAVKRRVELEGFGPWSEKAGVVHVQPPVRVLEEMATVRVHLDDSFERTGRCWYCRGHIGSALWTGI